MCSHIRPYEILKEIGQTMSMMFPLLLSSVYPVYHVSMSMKVIINPLSILPVKASECEVNG